MKRTTKRIRAQAGFTVLEAAVSMTVLAVALLALWGTIVYTSRSNVAAEQKKRALISAQAKIEELKSLNFDTLVARFGPSGTEGDSFEIPSIDGGDGEDCTASGSILFQLDETAVTCGDHGGPMDLNGDGDASDTDVSANFMLLPVQVTVRWNGPLGPQRMDLSAILRRED